MQIHTVSLRLRESLVNNADLYYKPKVRSYVCINPGDQLWYACQCETVYSSGGQNCSGWEKRKVRPYWGNIASPGLLLLQEPVSYNAGGTRLQCSVATGGSTMQ